MTTMTRLGAPNAAPTSNSAGGFGGSSPLAGELISAGDLTRQASYADGLAEQVEMLAGLLREWALQLPDRLAGAGWGTEAIDRAGDEIAGAADDLPQLIEKIKTMLTAVGEAEQMGSEVAARDASGRVEAFSAD